MALTNALRERTLCARALMVGALPCYGAPMGDRGNPPKMPTARRKRRDGLEITEEMISAAAEVLWMETSLDVSQTWAKILAKTMLQRALQGSGSETAEEKR